MHAFPHDYFTAQEVAIVHAVNTCMPADWNEKCMHIPELVYISKYIFYF